MSSVSLTCKSAGNSEVLLVVCELGHGCLLVHMNVNLVPKMHHMGESRDNRIIPTWQFVELADWFMHPKARDSVSRRQQ